MDILIKLFESVEEAIVHKGPSVLLGIVVFIGFLFIGRILTSFLNRIAKKKSNQRSLKSVEIVNRVIRFGMGVIGLIMALQLLGLTALATSLLATGGIVAIVLGFAFREIGENLLAGVFLSFSRSFEEGDLVESGGLRGVIRNINLRDIHIRTAEGCDIFIPSASIFRQPLHNFTRDGLRRGSFTVGIDYSDDLEQARSILLKNIQAMEKVLDDPAPSVQLSGFTPNYVELEAFFWVNTFDKESALASIRTRLMNQCHQVLSENDFTFSSNVKTGVTLDPVEIRMQRDDST